MLLAKPEPSGFSKDVLILTCSYLKNSKQRIVINNSASTIKIVACRIHARICKWLFTIQYFYKQSGFIYIVYNIGNYAVDINISISGRNKENLKKLLLSEFKTVTKWFHDNYMIVNLDRCSCMYLGKNNDVDTFSFN